MSRAIKPERADNHNTLDNLAPTPTVTEGCGGSASDKHAIRVNPSIDSRIVLWNNIVSRATKPYTQSGTLGLDASRSLFPPNTTTMSGRRSVHSPPSS